MGDTLFTIRIGDWDFGMDKIFNNWWYADDNYYEFLGYFWLFHREDNYTEDYKDGGFGLIMGDKIYID